tara:strand:- start:1061 stop:1696 length:636 start_codon:yes stop_codon:yes gene_type:complete
MHSPLLERLSYDDAQIRVESIENKDGSKNLFMKGIFIQGGVRNQNQRVYPIDEISKAVDSVNEKLQGGFSVLGEADHPEELTVNLDRVSHMITEMWMDGKNGYGKLKIIPTPMGNIVQTLLDSGAKLGVSSRGSGNVTEDGKVSDFEIVTVDVVAQPSAPDAYPQSMYESLMNMRGGYRMHGMARYAHVDKVAQKHLTSDIVKFINELKVN